MLLTCLLPLLAAQVAASVAHDEPHVRNVAIVVYDGVELLDFAGPGEVFSATRVDRTRSFRVYTVSDAKQEITSQRFVHLTPEFTYEDCPAPDIVVVPGGNVPVRSESLRAFLQRCAEKSELVMSVCNGAGALAGAGLLDGREVTTHHGSLEWVQLMAPDTTVLSNRRFVDSGRILTAAGVSAGIDGALHVVARMLGEEVAHQTAEYMEYAWRPDEIAALHAQPGKRVVESPLLVVARRTFAQGPEGGLAAYRAAVAAGEDVPSEERLNRVGYTQLSVNRIEHALDVFQLVTTLFPRSANACDSLAEALERAGRNEDALHWTERSLTLSDTDATLTEDRKELIRDAAEVRLARLRGEGDAGGYACPPCGMPCDMRRYSEPGHCAASGCGAKLVLLEAPAREDGHGAGGDRPH